MFAISIFKHRFGYFNYNFFYKYKITPTLFVDYLSNGNNIYDL